MFDSNHINIIQFFKSENKIKAAINLHAAKENETQLKWQHAHGGNVKKNGITVCEREGKKNCIRQPNLCVMKRHL